MRQGTDSSRRDVTVLGGGLAGLSLALQCRQQLPAIRITVLEKNRHPVPEAAFKVGESTVEVGARYFAEVLGLQQHILEHQLPKLGLRFFFPAGDNSQIDQRLELGASDYAPTPSYQLDRGRFENHLAECAADADIELIGGARVTQLDVRRWGRHRVSYERGGQTESIKTRWLIDASGRAALLKRQLGLHKPSAHRANAAWLRVDARMRVDDWSTDAAWRDALHQPGTRWLSTNHLMGDGYWVWLIPLASGSTSIGLVADADRHPLSTFNSTQKLMTWLQSHEPQCAEQLRPLQDRIQDFRAIRNYSTESSRAFSSARWGLTGEAGFFLDPFYSPGSDFIAFANTFLSDLIRRDFTGRPHRFRAFLYDRIFKRFFYGTAAVYEQQYPLFGNPQVMPIKILWDYMIYWSLTGFIFMHDRLCDALMYPRNMSRIRHLSQMNHCMQELFRQWHQRSPGVDVRGSIDTYQLELLRQANGQLSETLDGRAFSRAFTENVARVEALFWQIVDRSGISVRVPFQRSRRDSGIGDSLQRLFESTCPPHSTRAAGAGVAVGSIVR